MNQRQEALRSLQKVLTGKTAINKHTNEKVKILSVENNTIFLEGEEHWTIEKFMDHFTLDLEEK